MRRLGLLDGPKKVSDRYRRVNARAFREALAEVVEFSEKTKDPVILTRHGTDRAALVSIEDLWIIELLEKMDIKNILIASDDFLETTTSRLPEFIKKMSARAQAERWNPTPEEIHQVEELYKRTRAVIVRAQDGKSLSTSRKFLRKIVEDDASPPSGQPRFPRSRLEQDDPEAFDLLVQRVAKEARETLRPGELMSPGSPSLLARYAALGAESEGQILTRESIADLDSAALDALLKTALFRSRIGTGVGLGEGADRSPPTGQRRPMPKPSRSRVH